MTTWQSFTRKPFVRRVALGGVGVLILSVVAVRPAHSQFGIDTAAILAGLKAINNTLTNAVASPLRAINKVEQQEQQFQQNVLYPISAINSARQMATGFTASLSSFRQLGTLNISSATLPKVRCSCQESAEQDRADRVHGSLLPCQSRSQEGREPRIYAEAQQKLPGQRGDHPSRQHPRSPSAL